MSSNRLINTIRQDRKLSKAFDRLSNEQKRRVLEEAGGDFWHIDSIIEEVLEDAKCSK